MAIKEMGEWIIFRISDLHGMTSNQHSRDHHLSGEFLIFGDVTPAVSRRKGGRKGKFWGPHPKKTSAAPTSKHPYSSRHVSRKKKMFFLCGRSPSFSERRWQINSGRRIWRGRGGMLRKNGMSPDRRRRQPKSNESNEIYLVLEVTRRNSQNQISFSFITFERKYVLRLTYSYFGKRMGEFDNKCALLLHGEFEEWTTFISPFFSPPPLYSIPI